MTATTTARPDRRFRVAARKRRWRGRWPLLALLLTVGLLAGAVYVLYGTNMVAVRTVRVVGAKQVPASAVTQAAEVPIGTPLVRVDRGAVRRRVLRALPEVASVAVQWSWPSVLRVVIVERVPIAAVPQGGHYLLVDRTGLPFRTVAALPRGLVVVDVASPGPADPATRAALTVVAGLPADLRAMVFAVVAPTGEQVTVSLRGHRVVLWGDAADTPAKVAVVRVLLRRPGRLIDVSSPALVTVK